MLGLGRAVQALGLLGRGTVQLLGFLRCTVQLVGLFRGAVQLRGLFRGTVQLLGLLLGQLWGTVRLMLRLLLLWHRRRTEVLLVALSAAPAVRGAVLGRG